MKTAIKCKRPHALNGYTGKVAARNGDAESAGPSITLVQTTEAFEQLRGLLLEYEAELPDRLRHGVVPWPAELKGVYRARSAAFLASAAGVSAGCVTLRELDARTAVLQRLYVRAAFRGRGLARALMHAATVYASARNFSRIVLDTQRDALPQAHALYVSLGFRECAPYAKVGYAKPTFLEFLIEKQTDRRIAR